MSLNISVSQNYFRDIDGIYSYIKYFSGLFDINDLKI